MREFCVLYTNGWNRSAVSSISTPRTTAQAEVLSPLLSAASGGGKSHRVIYVLSFAAVVACALLCLGAIIVATLTLS